MLEAVILSVVGLILFGLSTSFFGSEIEKRMKQTLNPADRKRSNMEIACCIIMAMVGLLVIVAGIFCGHRTGRKFEARKRLSEPVASVMRLHGFEVSTQTTFKDDSNVLKHKADFVDVLPSSFIFTSLGIFKDVELTQEVSEEIKME